MRAERRTGAGRAATIEAVRRPLHIRRASCAGAAALLAVLALAGTAQAGTFEKAIWGSVTTPKGASAFPVYKRLGVDTFQIQLVWRDVALSRPQNPTDPRDPAYRWPAELRDAIRGARRQGIRVAVMVKGTPGWANGDKPINTPPDSDQDLADFFTAAVRHYPSVRRWMVWGEPSRLENWNPIPPHDPAVPRRYATLLDASYAAIKKADPRAIVIGGMTFTAGEVFPAEWTRYMRLPNGRPPRMDWWGHNPFSRRKPDLALSPYIPDLRDMSDIDTLQAEIATAYKGARMRVPRLWISEFNISSDRDNRSFDFHVSRAEQASWLTAAFRAAKRVGVAGMGWYGLYDEPSTVKGAVTYGLLQADGKAKPAFAAYRRVRSAPPPGR